VGEVDLVRETLPSIDTCAGLAGRADDDMTAMDDGRRVSDPERGLAGLDDEHLGVRVAVELRPDARPGVDEDHRERHVAVIGADELVGVLRVIEIVQVDDGCHQCIVSRRGRRCGGNGAA
jgi:hypothetical protein